MHPVTRARIDALKIDADRPILAVDADEVIVHWARDFAAWAEPQGYSYDHGQYRLEAALRHVDGAALPDEQVERMATRFVDAHTHCQKPVEGAVAALKELSGRYCVIVLTNVPFRAWEARETNMAALGIDAPVIANAGGKGAALAHLAARTGRGIAFIDDNPDQIASAAEAAPGVTRIHFAGCTLVRGAITRAPTAHHYPETWPEIVRLLT